MPPPTKKTNTNSGCGQNYHKRCIIKIPNNCSYAILDVGEQRRRRSSTLQVPHSPSETGSNSSLTSVSDESSGMVCLTFDNSPQCINFIVLFFSICKFLCSFLITAKHNAATWSCYPVCAKTKQIPFTWWQTPLD